MFYCFVNPSDIGAEKIAITGENFRHLKTVLRARPGENIRVRSDRFTYEARIVEIGEDRITARILSSKETPEKSKTKVILAAAVIQEKNFDLLLQQAVQLGVFSIQPILTKNTANHRIKPDRKERWQKIVDNASMQSQRSAIPAVGDIRQFDEVISGYSVRPGTRLVMPYELEEGRLIEPSLFEGATETVLFIGPEGGWSAEEAERARGKGVVTVSLGPNILRAETAALVSLTLVNRCLGTM